METENACNRLGAGHLGSAVTFVELAQLMADGGPEGEHERYVKAFAHVRLLADRYRVLRFELSTRTEIDRTSWRVFNAYGPYDPYDPKSVHPINRKNPPDEHNGRQGAWGLPTTGNCPPVDAKYELKTHTEEVVHFSAVVDIVEEFKDYRTRSFDKWLEVCGSAATSLRDVEQPLETEGRVSRTLLAEGWEFYNPVADKVRNFAEVFKQLRKVDLMDSQGTLGYLPSEVGAAAARLKPPLSFRKLVPTTTESRPAGPGWGPSGGAG